MGACCQAVAPKGPPLSSHQAAVDVAPWWRIGAAALVASQSMVLALAINLSEASPEERWAVGTALMFASLLVLGLLGRGLVTACWRALSARRISIELLFAMGIAGALGASTLALGRGHGAFYYEVVSILLIIYEGGRRISGSARQRALRQCSLADVDRAPHAVETTQGIVWKAGAELRPGDIVRTPAGARLPVDGVLLDPAAFVTDTELSGEPAASVRRAGDLLWAGTRAVDALRVSAQRVAGDRELERLERGLEQAMARPSAIERQADRLARRFVPAVAAVATATFALWAGQATWDRALYNALAVLLVACPCALGFATPLAVWMTLGQWARRGLVARSGELVERLAAVDTVVFDKTGTLTDPDCQSVRWRSLGVDDAWLVGLIRAVERCTEHPLASALRRALPDDASEARFTVAAVRSLPGRGLTAEVTSDAGRTLVVIGTPEIVSDEGDQARLHVVASELGASSASWLVAVTIEGRLAGVAVLDERVAASVPAALSQLRGLGLELALSTGDAAARAQRLQILHTLSRQTPEDKRAYVARLASAGRRVLFVGDGVNDAAAMAASHASVAVGRGALLPRQIAGLEWHGTDWETLPWAIARARATVGLSRAHLMLAAAYNILGITLAAAGLLHPVAAALLMLASSLSVIARTVRVLGPEKRASLAPSAEGASTPGAASTIEANAPSVEARVAPTLPG